jgi:hypothetical protein
METHFTKTIFLASCCSLAIGCSSSDSTPAPPLEAPIGDVSGTWSTLEVFSSSISECNDTNADTIDVTHDGVSNTLTMKSQTSGASLNGTISNNVVTWTGSVPYADGTLTYSPATVTVAPDCSSFQGSANWSYSETGFSCTGTSTISGDRTGGGTTC